MWKKNNLQLYVMWKRRPVMHIFELGRVAILKGKRRVSMNEKVKMKK